ncbi:MAG: nuclear transport factor 2 family protein [Acidimicrobiales bacterium]
MDFDSPAKLIEGIERYFGRDLGSWLACFDAPYAFVTADTTMVADDEDAARRQFAPAFKGLQAAGFASSIADNITTRFVGTDLALVDARFTRWHRDGTSMGATAALYVCRRHEVGWRIAAVIQHPPGDDALP